MRKSRRSGGFTLIELVASVGVASIALVATAAAVTSGSWVSQATAEQRAASRAAASIMDEIRATPFDQIVSTFNGTTRQVNAQGVDDNTGTSTVSIHTLGTGSTRWICYQVRVVTEWRPPTGPNRSEFVTYVTDRTAGTRLNSSPPTNVSATTPSTTTTGTGQ